MHYSRNDLRITLTWIRIPLISNLAKIVKTEFYHRLLEFIEKHEILSEKQYGFMKNIGTKDALKFLSNVIYENIGQKIPTAVNFLDLAKAFETVNRLILLEKINRYGIGGNA